MGESSFTGSGAIFHETRGEDFGWAYKFGEGGWHWASIALGFTRDEAIEFVASLRLESLTDEPARIGKVRVNVPPDGSPIDVRDVLERAEELYMDMPCLNNDWDEPCIDCTRADEDELRAALNATWEAWLAKRRTNAVVITDVEDVRW